jgi:hypothetical protein
MGDENEDVLGCHVKEGRHNSWEKVTDTLFKWRIIQTK